MKDRIRIQGARENNLKNVSLDIPKHQFVVVTGPSGSGKSTLALDILQRECQRQYMESSGMSGDSIEKPKVDSIAGLSPSISIGQHAANRNPRSTVGTVTDMYTYLRLVFQKIGERRCRQCQAVIPPASVDGPETVFCPVCHHPHPPLTKSDFSFNTPDGACPECGGLGTAVEIDIDAVFEKEKSIKGGAVTFWYDMMSEYQAGILEAAGRHYGFEMSGDQPLSAYNETQWDLLLYGVESEAFSRRFPDIAPPKTVGKGKFEGVLTGMWRRYKEKEGQSGEAAYFITQPCTACGGERLNEESRRVTVMGKTLPNLSNGSLAELHGWIERLQSKLQQEKDALLETVLHDLLIKVKRVINVGLGYLSLDRNSVSLSGGETQRLRLASILGSGLTGVLYLLDEPTSGLHPKDTDGLIRVMKDLRDLGNTVVVIEHDERVIQEADHVIDIGPGAGRFGGEIVGQGTLKELLEQPHSVTGRYFKEKRTTASKGRKGNGKHITIHEADRHNLRAVTVSIPLGCLVSVTGVSGSGKSTLIFDLLAQAEKGKTNVQGCRMITGMDAVENVVKVGQAPISRMQRSSVSTYIDLYTLLRKLFAAQPEAKEKGLKANSFSFNTPGGRCDRCEGLGQVSVDMHFLSHLQVACPDCRGKRFNREVLTVKYKGHSIADILELCIEESLSLFTEQKKITKLLKLLCEVGLGYLQWGQQVTTLSGGEGQRLKLAKELSKSASGHNLYLLDEPSAGLHPLDVQNLRLLLDKLVDAGHTVIMVEHNTDLIGASDWVIDMGPGGGADGGKVVASGAPREVACIKESVTGAFLHA
ncbi:MULTISPECIES: excinuclease ABC subunit UvrA [Bacillus]|uniref:UvrABC system protein A n=1 Tax=Bacillus glycinifermentans TaxID=1664069 RepID=A0AAJ4D1D5_9BACI|nr:MULTISPECIES: excinuclease ABC subunit UvrA [Bacillus]KKB75544.1 excinuclease ABC subunit A [Bacillus sp. TH008]MDU0071251.1 excinuclease ABC subunit UvrA [Bacillus sp. IG6]MED8019120.1 excinuclease ABC subunit UvrA [Bacillus glycinifermentans]QAT63701.1 excinuclease ABC subunit A [Bacillus glycinifermentans]WKB77570.1 excinuclease ABC subunit UvrA [Bacillus glycinifermentans]